MNTPNKPIRILSLGAGVQSTALILMAYDGEFGDDYPRHAIFADTGDEPIGVYRHLWWLANYVSDKIQVIITSKGHLSADILRAAKVGGTASTSNPPFHVARPGHKKGMSLRKCTRDYKVRPIARVVRRIAGLGDVEQWIGISLDEVWRMKPSGTKRIQHRWPLIELRMSRSGCLGWLENSGYPRPPKSACVYCPYRSPKRWRDVRSVPEDWDRAVAFDSDVRRLSLPGLDGVPYVHRSLAPLGDADLGSDSQIDMFLNECEGLCGV